MDSGRDTNGQAASELPAMGLPFDAAAFVPAPRGADEDGMPSYRQAVGAMRNLGPPPGEQGRTDGEETWAWYAPWEKTPQNVRDWLAAAGPALEFWRAGSRRPGALWLSPDKITWPAVDRLAEELHWVRRLLSAAHLEGRRLWSVGKPEEALRLYLDLLRSAEHLYRRPVLIQAMMAVTFADRAYEELHAWSVRPEVTPELLVEAAAELARLPAPWRPAEMLRCEMLLARPEAGTLTPDEAQRYAGLAVKPTEEGLARHYRWFRIALAMLEEQAGLPPGERSPAYTVHRGRLLLIPGESFCQRNGLPPIEVIDRAAHADLAFVTLPYVVGGMVAIDRAAVRRNVALAWLAVWTYRKRQGRFPPKLDDAMAEVDLPPPADPFDRDGGPLRYRLSGGERLFSASPVGPQSIGWTPYGRPLLYSVGPDGVDDHGTLLWSDELGGRGDWVFLQPEVPFLKRKRRWQFSLRGLLVLTALVAALLGGYVVPRVRRQQAVEALAAQGARTELDWALPINGAANRERKLLGPWFFETPGYLSIHHERIHPRLDLSPLRYLPELSDLNLSHPGITDADLTPIAEMRELVELTIHSSGVTDASLEYIREMRQLGYLDLSGTQVTGKGLSLLTALPLEVLELRETKIGDEALPAIALWKLESLALNDTRVTDNGLPALARMGSLHYLNLEGTTISDDGLQALAPLNELSSLYLDRTEVTDAGLAHLRTFADLDTLSLYQTNIRGPGLAAVSDTLTRLSLGGTDVDDAGLEQVARFEKLRSLHLSDCPITDAGLVHLRGLRELSYLDLDGTKVTDAGLEELWALPKLSRLDVSRTAVTPAGVKRFLAAMPGVEVQQ